MPSTPETTRPHGIAMWGPPGCGKTTFLAALNIAFIRNGVSWSLIAADTPSANFLIEQTSALSRDLRFPQATTGLSHYRWSMIERGTPPGRRRSLWRRRHTGPTSIDLEVIDVPGGFYSKRHGTAHDGVVDILERSRGILLFFDPIREFEQDDAFNHLHGVLSELARRMLISDEHRDGKLPHYVAVCVTKFDEVRVVSTAQRLGLLTVEPDDPLGFPRVEDDDARDLLTALSRVSFSSAEMLPVSLDQFFQPDRVRYFVSSSIGFYVAPNTTTFDPEDYQNVIPEITRSRDRRAAPRGTQIRGRVYPINVMEPMLWLGSRLSHQRR